MEKKYKEPKKAGVIGATIAACVCGLIILANLSGVVNFNTKSTIEEAIEEKNHIEDKPPQLDEPHMSQTSTSNCSQTCNTTPIITLS